MKKLPKWCVTDKFPALYDTESATAIEMVAKLYGSMSELVDDYNSFVDRINADIEAFENSTEQNIELFKVAIRQEFQDFIDVINLKIMSQDKAIADKFKEQDDKIANKFAEQDEIIADAVNFMKNNIQATLERIVSEMKESGEMAEIVAPIVVETVHDVIKPNGVHTEYELLWENQTPDVVFAGQEIELNEDVRSKFDEFLITYKFRTDSAYDQFYIYLKNRQPNLPDYITGSAGGYVSGQMLEYVYVEGVLTPLRRLAYISSNGISFDECRTVRAENAEQLWLNEALIPCKIYGVSRFAYTDDLKTALDEVAPILGGV